MRISVFSNTAPYRDYEGLSGFPNPLMSIIMISVLVPHQEYLPLFINNTIVILDSIVQYVFQIKVLMNYCALWITSRNQTLNNHKARDLLY